MKFVVSFVRVNKCTLEDDLRKAGIILQDDEWELLSLPLSQNLPDDRSIPSWLSLVEGVVESVVEDTSSVVAIVANWPLAYQAIWQTMSHLNLKPLFIPVWDENGQLYYARSFVERLVYR